MLVTTANRDITGDSWVCRKVSELESTAKLVYYGVRLIKYIETLAPPP